MTLYEVHLSNGEVLTVDGREFLREEELTEFHGADPGVGFAEFAVYIGSGTQRRDYRVPRRHIAAFVRVDVP